MSKIIPFALAGVGATATSVGGVYLIRGTTPEPQKQPSAEKKLLFESVEAFKKATDANQTECLRDHFQGLNISTEDGDNSKLISASNTVETNYLGTAPTNTTTPYKSCLIVDWTKTTYGTDTNAKWNGKLMWLWTFVNGDGGFINFNVAETDTADANKMKFTGVFYLVKKEDSTWKIKHKKSVSPDKKAAAGELDQHFPKPHGNLNLTNKTYWGFVDAKEKLNSMCKAGECTGDKREVASGTHTFTWEKGTESSKTLKDWSTDFGWWEKLYGAEHWSLKDKLTGFIGAWKAKS